MTSVYTENNNREESGNVGTTNSDGSNNNNKNTTPEAKGERVVSNNDIPTQNGVTPGDEKVGLIPPKPKGPIRIARNLKSNKYVFPKITREDTLNARMYLKYHGLQKFLDTYLPAELNSLYLYFLIKLLGFEIKDRELVAVIYKNINPVSSPVPESDLTYDIDVDPLEKKHVVRLIKDFQKTINKVLSTRLRLSNFYTIDHFVSKLKTANRILVLTGAGVSTSIGIPDFRSSEGFYSRIKHLGLDDPQDVFNLDIFMQDPSVFYNIAHMVLPPENKFTPLHGFIKLLQNKGKLLRNYTQNIDNLESYAGIAPDKLVQCHGSFATASCITCHWQLPGEKIFDNIRNLELPLCPYCYQRRREFFPILSNADPDADDPDGMGNPRGDGISDSNANGKLLNSSTSSSSNLANPPVSHSGSALKSYGVLKPDITFFGEALPSKFHRTIREDILKCDLLICIGTSLKVAPVSEIINMVPAHVPQVLINKDPVKHAEFDLTLLGYCDDIAAYIAKKCGWSIPHKDWPTLKNKKIECVEKDKGVYLVGTPPLASLDHKSGHYHSYNNGSDSSISSS